MTLRDWFIEPRTGGPSIEAPRRSPPATAELAGFAPPENAGRWSPPEAGVPPPKDAPPAAREFDALAPPEEAGRWSPPEAGVPPPKVALPGSAGGVVRVPPPRSMPPPAGEVAARGISSAAVLGRAGEAEPVAAGIALALLRSLPARAATVVVVGEGEPLVAGGGTPSARRLAARLAAHGFEAVERGRLAWARVPAGGARRAVVAGAPAVLAVTVPLTAALETTIAEQDLAVIVTPDEDGPLARLAVASLARAGPPVVTSRPLPRGLVRALAGSGLTAPRSAREIVAEHGSRMGAR